MKIISENCFVEYELEAQNLAHISTTGLFISHSSLVSWFQRHLILWYSISSGMLLLENWDTIAVTFILLCKRLMV